MNTDITTFQKTIQDDPVYFLDNILGGWHWSKQDEIIRAVFAHQRVTVKSCF